jgi:hypothetical protein
VGDSLRWQRDTLYPLKLALTSPKSGGRSVGIVRACGLNPRSFYNIKRFVRCKLITRQQREIQFSSRTDAIINEQLVLTTWNSGTKVEHKHFYKFDNNHSFCICQEL